MLDITKDIQSLTTFRRRSGDSMKQLKKAKRAVVLTVKGKAAAIVQDEDAKQGKVRPAREFFAGFEATHGIPRQPNRPHRTRSCFPAVTLSPRSMWRASSSTWESSIRPERAHICSASNATARAITQAGRRGIVCSTSKA